jgi:tetratricopeptide (TPR) repeat protein
MILVLVTFDLQGNISVMRFTILILLVLIQFSFTGISRAMASKGAVPSRAAFSKTKEGALLFSRDDYKGAYNAYTEAVALMKDEMPQPSLGLVRALLGSGWCCLKLDNFTDGEKFFNQAMLIVETGSLKDSLLEVEVLMAYAKLYDRFNDNYRAAESYEKAIKSLYKQNPAYWLTLASTLDDYACFIRRLPEQQGWFGVTGIALVSVRDPRLLEKRANLLRKRAKKEPYKPE